jgi:mono/diheme cytochrome c family protein
MSPVTIRILFLTLAATWLVGGSARAEQGPLPEHRGYGEFQQYCASCHGVNADGKGPLAPVLNVPPADLRLLSVKYGKPLPRPKLVAFIDGRERVRGHGSREMPVWGKKLHAHAKGDPARQGQVRSTILVIIDYIEALQIEDPGAS